MRWPYFSEDKFPMVDGIVPDSALKLIWMYLTPSDSQTRHGCHVSHTVKESTTTQLETHVRA